MLDLNQAYDENDSGRVHTHIQRVYKGLTTTPCMSSCLVTSFVLFHVEARLKMSKNVVSHIPKTNKRYVACQLYALQECVINTTVHTNLLATSIEEKHSGLFCILFRSQVTLKYPLFHCISDLVRRLIHKHLKMLVRIANNVHVMNILPVHSTHFVMG